ncbi:MAG: aspartyl protease family protein [bacterium]|nr:aspartyl protease family protein [bacterium]
MTTICLNLVASNLSAATIPFDPSQGLVVVEATIDGRLKGRFGIDTGADYFYLDKEYAKENGLKIIPGLKTRGATGVEGSDAPSVLSITSLRIGDEEVKNISARAIDLSKFISDPRASLPDGFIGGDVLREFYVTIDYPNSSLTLTKSKPDFLRGKRYSKTGFRLYKDHIIVDAKIGDHSTMPMLFDYCASVTVLSQKKAEAYGLPTDRTSVYRIDIAVDTELASEDVVAVTRDLTQLSKSMPRVDIGGIIGASFLRTHKITIDYATKTIYVHDQL